MNFMFDGSLEEELLPAIAGRNLALKDAIMSVRRSALDGKESAAIIDSQGYIFELMPGDENTVGSGSETAWREATASAMAGNEIYAIHSHPGDVGASYQDFIANEEIARATGIVPRTIIATPNKVYDYVPGETGYGGLTPNYGYAWYERHGIKPGESYNEPKWFFRKAYLEYGYMHDLFVKDITVEELVRRRDATTKDVSERLGFKVNVYNIDDFGEKPRSHGRISINQFFKVIKSLF